jgi:hypothetical protein
MRRRVCVSKSPEVTMLSVATHVPERCLFVRTPETKNGLIQIHKKTGRPNADDPTVLILAPGDEERICAEIATWLLEQENAAVDITAGTKEMSAVLIAAARRASARVLYLRHEMLDDTQTQQYGTERFINATFALR